MPFVWLHLQSYVLFCQNVPFFIKVNTFELHTSIILQPHLINGEIIKQNIYRHQDNLEPHQHSAIENGLL